MSERAPERAVRTNRLREAYGEEVVLTENGREHPTVYRIALEFDWNGRTYAALRPVSARDDELELFTVRRIGDGTYEIETIEDEDEWESAAELADDMLAAFSDD